MSYEEIPEKSFPNSLVGGDGFDDEEIDGIPTVSPAPPDWDPSKARIRVSQARTSAPPEFGTLTAVSKAVVRDFAIDFLAAGVISMTIAAWGGIIFLSEETSYVVVSVADDEGIIESIGGAEVSSETARLVSSQRRLSLYSSPKRFIGLLTQTALIPVGCACLFIFALQSYKAVLLVGEAGKARAPPANSLVYLDEWRWRHATTVLHAFVALYASFAVICFGGAVAAGVSLVDGLVRVVCRQEELCSFVLSYQHVLSLDSSGVEQVSTAEGAAYIMPSLVFALLFAALTARTALVRRVVLVERSRTSRAAPHLPPPSAATTTTRFLGVGGEELLDEGYGDDEGGQEVGEVEEDEDSGDDDNPFGPPTEAEALLGKKSYGGMDDTRGNFRSSSSGGGSSSGSSGGSSLPHRHRKNKTKTAVLVLVFVFVFPTLFLLALLLPDSFSDVSVALASSAASSAKDISAASGNLSMLAALLARHLDLVLFYAYLYTATLFGVLSQLSDRLRRLMLRRSKLIATFAPSCMPYSVSNAQALLFLLLLALVAAEALFYFAWQPFPRMQGSALPTVLERAARTAGSLCKVMLAFSLLPVVRNSVWCVAFGLNRSSLLKVHEWTANAFLALALAHAGLMAAATARVGETPFSAFPDDFTVGLVSAAAGFALVSGLVLSRACVRRASYEVFLVAHTLSFGVLAPAVVWHADGAWKFLSGGLALWASDALIRFARASSFVEVREASLMARRDVLRLSYVIEEGGNLCATPKAGRRREPMLHGMAQHVFINVPEISRTEWHPFSISSAAEDEVTTHHIKTRGHDSFTGRLHALLLLAKEEGRLDKIRLNVDGPYGVPLEYQRYEKIIFVAGGIGITNIHSSFKTLYVLAKAGLLPVTRVHLIWVAKDPAYFEMFADTFHSVSNDSLHTRFKFSFYVTQEHTLMGDELYGTRTPTPSVPFKLGRPNLLRELVGLSAYGMHALINASGPEDLRHTCHRLAIKCGVDFQDETFEL